VENPKLKIKSIIKTPGISKAMLYKYLPMGKSSAENKKQRLILFSAKKLVLRESKI
jgi:hypothetical protein